MATGDSNDIVWRVRRLIPSRWFAWVAPYRDAVLGGLADQSALLYNFIIYARQQIRLATANGVWLDIWSRDFLGRHLLRKGRSDGVYSTLIQATILQERVTRAGMMAIVTSLVGIPPRIFEPWSTGDAGSWGFGNIGYGIAGGWGSIQLPGQVFIQVSRAGTGPTGVPNVEGYGGGYGGYGQGAIQYIGVNTAEIGVTDQDIYDAIVTTKPSGVTAWVQIGQFFSVAAAAPQPTPTGGTPLQAPLPQPETASSFTAATSFIGRFVRSALKRFRF